MNGRLFAVEAPAAFGHVQARGPRTLMSSFRDSFLSCGIFCLRHLGSSFRAMQPENTEPPPELSAPEPEVEHEGEPATPQKAEPVVFASPADPRHIEELCRRFARSFTIDAAEHRAISSVQLTDVLTFALTGCWQWDEAQLKAHSLNHYDVMKWLIKPTTEARCCSFVELVASEAQPPDFFLSHYFGQPVRDVLDSVRQQLSTRQLVEETTFWMWAYARRHDESVVPDRLHSTAFQAMGLSSGILLPLGTTSVPLSRTWCLLEVALAVLELQKPLDIVASALQGPVLLTQDLTEPERRMEGKLAGAGFREKNHREQAFPADILIAALDIGLERSDAASKMDRNRLLHKFVEEGGEAFAMPHRQFDKINVKLRGLFASMMWLQVVESDRLPRNSVAECTKANVSKDSFVVNVCNSRMDDSSMHYLSRALHKNLARVDLNFWMCPKISAKGVEDLVRLMPAKLKTVNLNFKLCPGVGQGGLDAVSNSFPSGLTSLHLNFSFNSEIRSLATAAVLEGREAGRLRHLGAQGGPEAVPPLAHDARVDAPPESGPGTGHHKLRPGAGGQSGPHPGEFGPLPAPGPCVPKRGSSEPRP
ncbi:unnamed protein product [Effrenium voratum]|uniref:Uncharacterized protein n=1 Tax=Effrenium voratum TaxID=2562239 RepID=A0AA36HK37_9DINO|nr:unnamed protein product [Effrenium voratum]